jgi:hypothetical protein
MGWYRVLAERSSGLEVFLCVRVRRLERCGMCRGCERVEGVRVCRVAMCEEGRGIESSSSAFQAPDCLPS